MRGAHSLLISTRTEMKRTSTYKSSAAKKQTQAKGFAGRTAPIYSQKRVKRDYPELKFKDTTYALNTPNAAGTITNDTLAALSEGNTDQTRIGNKINVKSIMLRGRALIDNTAAAANTSDVLRIIVYLDRQANGATAAVTDILATGNWRSFNNLDNNDRFRTLCEWTCSLNVGGATPSGGAYVFGRKTKEFFLKAKLGQDFKYKGNAGTVADLASSNIGVLAISAQGTVQLEYIARLKFVDI